MAWISCGLDQGMKVIKAGARHLFVFRFAHPLNRRGALTILTTLLFNWKFVLLNMFNYYILLNKGFVQLTTLFSQLLGKWILAN